jgi:ADP-heptose:LPS heptosyltransferase
MTLKHRLRDSVLKLVPLVAKRPSAGDPATMLVVRPDHLGDILLSQPAVRLLREALPDTRMIGVVGPWSREIAAMALPFDEFVSVPFPGFQRGDRMGVLDRYKLLFTASEELRRYRAGSAVVLRADDWWGACLAWLSVSGEVYASSDSRVSSFATRTVEIPENLHALERSYRIAELVTSEKVQPAGERVVTIPRNSQAAEEAGRLLQTLGVDRPYLVLHPAAGEPVKYWPTARWRALLQQLPDFSIVLTGVLAEEKLCAQIAAGNPQAVSLAGRTSLPILTEILREATLVIGPDTGPIHLAAAVGTPTVSIFGPSDPNRFRPWGPPAMHTVVQSGWQCRSCGNLSFSRPESCGCVLAVPVNAVYQAVRAELSNHAAVHAGH